VRAYEVDRLTCCSTGSTVEWDVEQLLVLLVRPPPRAFLAAAGIDVGPPANGDRLAPPRASDQEDANAHSSALADQAGSNGRIEPGLENGGTPPRTRLLDEEPPSSGHGGAEQLVAARLRGCGTPQRHDSRIRQ
jgi:hypothetical protein